MRQSIATQFSGNDFFMLSLCTKFIDFLLNIKFLTDLILADFFLRLK